MSFGTGLAQGLAQAMQLNQLQAERERQIKLEKQRIKLQEDQIKFNNEYRQFQIENATKQLQLQQAAEARAAAQAARLQQQPTLLDILSDPRIGQKFEIENFQQNPEGGFTTRIGRSKGSEPITPEIARTTNNPEYWIGRPISELWQAARQGQDGQIFTRDAPPATALESFSAKTRSIGIANRMKELLPDITTGVVAGPLASTAGKYTPVGEETAEFDSLATRMRLDLQESIPGVPSDKDQELLNGLTPSPKYRKEYNGMLIDDFSKITTTAISMMIGAYKGTKTPIPVDLVNRAMAYGVDINSAQPNDGQYTLEDVMRKAKVDVPTGAPQQETEGMSDAEYEAALRELGIE